MPQIMHRRMLGTKAENVGIVMEELVLVPSASECSCYPTAASRRVCVCVCGHRISPSIFRYGVPATSLTLRIRNFKSYV
jgi:hypothetical protein